eukprot:2487303-Pyramimonas_sp.AAC.2
MRIYVPGFCKGSSRGPARCCHCGCDCRAIDCGCSRQHRRPYCYIKGLLRCDHVVGVHTVKSIITTASVLAGGTSDEQG